MLEYLASYFDITLFFYNPNMDSTEEYIHRSKELQRLVREANFPADVIICEYDPESFEEVASGLEDVPEGGARCRKCYELRMRKAAEYASGHGFEYFTTTLSISPYKNAGWINEIGERLAGEYGVKHLPSDFKETERIQKIHRTVTGVRTVQAGLLRMLILAGKKKRKRKRQNRKGD